MRCAEAFAATDGNTDAPAEAIWAIYGQLATTAETFWRDEVAAELIHTAAQMRTHLGTAYAAGPMAAADQLDRVATLVNGTAPGSVRRDLDIVKASRP